MASALLSVTYSVFDNIVGPKLLFSSPAILSKEVFEALSDYVIVGQHLCNKIIVVKTEDIQFVNYAMAIDNPKYERNALLFAFGFVLTRDVESEPFEPILRKLSSTFLSLELEREFLFREETRSLIPSILNRIYEDLNAKGEAFVEIDPSNFLAVKLFRSPYLPPLVQDFDVPVLCYDRNALTNLPWDIAIRHLLGTVDGVSHVQKLASKEAGMDVDIVRRCLRTLCHYNCVILTDIMRFSNVYQLAPRGRSVCSNNPSTSSIFRDMAHFSALDRATDPPSTTKLLRLLSEFRPGRTLAEVLIQFGIQECAGINIRRLLAFCQHKKILRRIHEYPVLTAGSYVAACSPDVNQKNEDGDIANYNNNMTGKLSLDALLTTYSLNQKTLAQTSTICVVRK